MPVPTRIPIPKTRNATFKPHHKLPDVDPVVLEFISRQPASSTWTPPKAVSRADAAMHSSSARTEPASEVTDHAADPPPTATASHAAIAESSDPSHDRPSSPVAAAAIALVIRWCRRSVPRRHFHSHDVRAPPPESLDCKRCVPRTPTICCDLDVYDIDGGLPETVPLFIRRFLLYAPPEKPPRGPNKTGIPKAYKYGAKESKLETALRDWRDQKHFELFSRSSFGSTALLSDELIRRIAGLGHFKSLATTAQLSFQTHWELSSSFGNDILPLIEDVFPGQQAPAAPADVVAPSASGVLIDLTNVPDRSGTPLAKKPRAAPRCSACLEAGDEDGAAGHTKASPRCPQKHVTDSRRAEAKLQTAATAAIPSTAQSDHSAAATSNTLQSATDSSRSARPYYRADTGPITPVRE